MMLSRVYPLSWNAMVLGAAVFAVSGCLGNVGDAEVDMGGMTTPGALSAGPAKMRRMTRLEYSNTIRDLLGDTTRPGNQLSADEPVAGFDANSSAPVTLPQLQQYAYTAETLAQKVPATQVAFLGCDVASGEDSCARKFISAFGKRAYRRPLDATDEKELFAMFDQERKQGGFESGIRLVVQYVLQSPFFLYRPETGMKDKNVLKLTGYEVASRLSYALWATMPDDELLTAADNKSLEGPVGVAAQMARMTASPRFSDGLASFYGQWLDLDALVGRGKNPALFPKYSDAVAKAAAEETLRFAENVVRGEGEGSLTTLLTAPYSYITAPLAPIYGVTAPKTAGAKVDMPTNQRSGLLTQVSFLALQAHENQTNPIGRGGFVRTRFMCRELPSPPPDVKITIPVPKAGLTTRQIFEAHRAAPACMSCHKLLEPVGFGFENYDAIGAYRTMDNKLPVDARGDMMGSDDIDGPFTGALELSKKLAESEQVRECMVRQWLRYTLGRQETEADVSSLQQIGASFRTSGGKIQSLIEALAVSPAFRYIGVQ